MKTIKIFLASSNELEHEREQFEIEIGRKNKAWHEHGVFLHLDIWEDLSARISQTRSQDEYNTKIKEADVFILLAYSKVGMYTEEEFETAFGSFKATNKPFIFTYFKDIDTTPEESLDTFKNKLKELGHFYAPYTEFDNLWNQFNKELDRLLLADFTKNEQLEKNTSISVDNKQAYIEKQYITYNNSVTNSSKKINKQLGDIPVNPEVFIGRDRSTKEVYTRLTNKESLLLLVNGEGGIGKTTLASQYYFDYFEYYTHLLWLFAENGIQNALLSLALPLHIQFPTQATQEEQLDLIIRELSELTKPILLVIDNANDLKDLLDNDTILRKFKKIDILLTSRVNKYKSFPVYKVKHLTKKAANSLFKKYYTSFIDDEQLLLDQLLEAIGYNTLVIELLAKNLTVFNNSLKKRYPLQKLLEDIQGKGLLQISQSAEVDSDYQFFIKATPEAIISVMYDITRLSEAEKTTLSIFGVLPATAILFSDLESFLPTIEDLDEVLLRLSQKGWLEYDTTQKSFKNNPIIAEITREQNKERISNDTKPLIKILINSLNYEINTGHIQGNFKDILKIVSFSEVMINYWEFITNNDSLLYDRLGNFYQTYGSLIVAKKYFKTYAYFREEFHKKSPSNTNLKHQLGIAYSTLGDLYITLGNLDKAKEFYLKDTTLSEELHITDPTDVNLKDGLAIAYDKQGEIYTSLGDLEKAKEFYKKNLDIREELHNKDLTNIYFKNGLAVAYERQGDLHKSLKDLEKAKEFYLKETTLFEELHINNPTNVSLKHGLAIAYSKLGDIYKSLEDVKKAKEFYVKETTLFEELHTEDIVNITFKSGLAVSYNNLGYIYTNLGDLDKAKGFYLKDTLLSEELHSNNPTNVTLKNRLAISYYKLGYLYTNHLNQKTKGLPYILKTKEILKELTTNFPEYAEFKNNYGFITNLLKDLEEE